MSQVAKKISYWGFNCEFEEICIYIFLTTKEAINQYVLYLPLVSLTFFFFLHSSSCIFLDSFYILIYFLLLIVLIYFHNFLGEKNQHQHIHFYMLLLFFQLFVWYRSDCYNSGCLGNIIPVFSKHHQSAEDAYLKT